MTPVEAYARIASVYDETPNPLLALERRTIQPLLPSLQGRIVADVGAGTGRWLYHARSVGARTIALDMSPQMLALAPGSRVLADGIRTPLRDRAVDVAFCTFTLGYSPCFPELARILRPGGTLIVSDVHPDAISRGWSRTFRVGGEVLEPDHHAYSIDDLFDPTLTRLQLLEPSLGEAERPIFAAANKLALYEAACAFPAIFVGVWTKRP